MEGDCVDKVVEWAKNVFQSTPSAWRETSLLNSSAGIWAFQSTPSAWRETSDLRPSCQSIPISIHSLRMEGDLPLRRWCRSPYHFNPLPPHGGRHIDLVDGDPAIIISIHSLRMEGDFRTSSLPETQAHFNPLPPHGGRPDRGVASTTVKPFQSTPSAWRETSGQSGL